MPLDDSDPYWAARFRMTPDQMDALRRKAEATVRAGYHATTRAMAEAGEAGHRLGDQAGAAVDRFKVGVQAEIDEAPGASGCATCASAPPWLLAFVGAAGLRQLPRIYPGDFAAPRRTSAIPAGIFSAHRWFWWLGRSTASFRG